MLILENVSCGYTNPKGTPKIVLEHFSMQINPGEIWCILGRNGIGKTTLFMTILGAIPTIGGTILLHDRAFSSYSKRDLAKEIAYVPQYHTPPFPFTVREIILMGRNAYISSFGAPSAEDILVAETVMDDLGIRHLEDQNYTQISGGERQMVLIARAMAQKPRILMMDEPTANLDYGNQVKMLRQIRALSSQGIAVVFTSHHPEHAFLCDANVTAIISKDTAVSGRADQVITEELIKKMYGIRSKVFDVQAPDGHSARNITPFL